MSDARVFDFLKEAAPELIKFLNDLLAQSPGMIQQLESKEVDSQDVYELMQTVIMTGPALLILFQLLIEREPSRNETH